jgi:hypothetical protein
MTKFLQFLQWECPAIHAFVEEVGNQESSSISSEPHDIVQIKIAELFSKIGDIFVDCNILDQEQQQEEAEKTGELEETIDTENSHDQKRRRKIQTWSPSLRISIIDHLLILDINVCLLVEVVESYKFDLDGDDLVEVMRSFDILGAERRLREYETVFYLLLEDERDKKENAWETKYGSRLPINTFDRIIAFSNHKL